MLTVFSAVCRVIKRTKQRCIGEWTDAPAVRSGVVDTESAPDIHNITPLDLFFSKHRAEKSLIPFFTLPVNYHKIFYEKLYFIILILGPNSQVAWQQLG